MSHISVRTKHQATVSPSIPTTMRAAAIDRFGGPDVLTLHELPVPSLAPDEVLIAVHTAGVGSWDAEMRGGWWPYKYKAKFPLVLGSDGSGTIAAKGSRVRRFQLGDRVYSFNWEIRKGGFYATYAAVPAENVAPIPDGLDLEQAGGVPVVGLTALQGIDDQLKLKKGERILIHGASGGVGSLALQFARGRGAQVLATASGDDGVALALQLGAEAAIDGKRENLLEAVRLLAGEGFDAIFATVGHELLALLETLRPGGRVAFPNGVEPAPKKRKGIKILSYDAASGVREFERLNKAVEAVGLTLPISKTFALADAAKAQELAQKGHVVGKIVLRVREKG
jgi:NADPH:quinone reductase